MSDGGEGVSGRAPISRPAATTFAALFALGCALGLITFVSGSDPDPDQHRGGGRGRQLRARRHRRDARPRGRGRMPTLRDLATSPWLRDVCRDLIGPDVNLYWDQAVYKKPEKPRRFPWHRDNGPDAPVEVPADAPDRQFPVLRDGRAVGHPTS